MAQILGQNLDQDLKIASDVIFANLTLDSTDDDIKDLAFQVKAGIDKTADLSVIRTLGKPSERRLKAAAQGQLSDSQTKQYKRVVQLTSGILRGQIKSDGKAKKLKTKSKLTKKSKL